LSLKSNKGLRENRRLKSSRYNLKNRIGLGMINAGPYFFYSKVNRMTP
jgi:hypothetical protein